MPKSEDVTDKLLVDSSYGPGDPARVARAKAAKTLTPTLQATLDEWRRKHDRSLGFTSKPLAYGFRFISKSEHTNLIRLMKGGHLRVCQVDGKPPDGSNAKSSAPYGDRYYVIRESCPAELPEGALQGSRRRKRR